jgi:hypothetical protein
VPNETPGEANMPEREQLLRMLSQYLPDYSSLQFN